jgi:cobalt-zinc-cadmium efflux system membrane fusion protein
MNTRTILTLIASFLAAGGLAKMMAPSRSDESAKARQSTEFKVSDREIEVSPEASQRLKLEVLELKPTVEVVTLHLTGKTSFDWDHVAHVKAQYPGKLMTIGPALGTVVQGPVESPEKKGTFLCTIESIDLGIAKNVYQKAVVQLDLDQETAKRVKELVDARVLADRFQKEADAALRMDEANVEFARQSLFVFSLKEEDLQRIQGEERAERMSYDLSSPISGVIVEKNVTRGEFADSTVNLFTISNTSRMWVWGDVYEKDWDKVKVGQKMAVAIAAFPGRTYETAIDMIAPSLDPTTRGIRVRGKIDNSDGKILKDMYSNLKVKIAEDPGALAAPSEAIVRGLQTDEAYVFVRKSGPGEMGPSTYERRPVRVQMLEGSRVRFLDGVKAGEAVVVNGAGTLFDEMRRK